MLPSIGRNLTQMRGYKSGLVDMQYLILVHMKEYMYIGNLMMLSDPIPMSKYIKISKHSPITKLQNSTTGFRNVAQKSIRNFLLYRFRPLPHQSGSNHRSLWTFGVFYCFMVGILRVIALQTDCCVKWIRLANWSRRNMWFGLSWGEIWGLQLIHRPWYSQIYC